MDDIISTCSNVFNINSQLLQKGKRGIDNFPRKIAIYCSRMVLGSTFTEIAKQFNLNNHSHISNLIKEIESIKTPEIKKLIDEIYLKVIHSQRNT